MIVLGIDTATPQTSIALGTERGTIAEMALSVGARSHEEIVVPAVEHLLKWSDTSLRHVSGITFTNVDVEFAKGDGRPAFAVDDGQDVRWTDSLVERSTGPLDLRATRTAGLSLVRTTTLDGQPLRASVSS